MLLHALIPFMQVLGLKCLELTGDVEPDASDLEAADLVRLQCPSAVGLPADA